MLLVPLGPLCALSFQPVPGKRVSTHLHSLKDVNEEDMGVRLVSHPIPGLLPCPWPSSTLSSCCPSDPSSLTHEASFSPHICLQHGLSHTSVGQCHTVPLDPRPNISCTTAQSHPQFTDLLNQACGVPKLERSCWTWKADGFLPPKTPSLSGAHWPSCPVTWEVCGVLVGSQPVLACHLWDGHLPAETLSYTHQLISHRPQTAPREDRSAVAWPGF